MAQERNSKFGALWGGMVKRLGNWQQEAMYQKLLKQTSLAPRLTLSKAILFVVSLLVHLTTLFFMVASIYLILTSLHTFWGLVGALVFLLIGWVMRPRFPLPDQDQMTRSQYPNLFRLIDRVAAQIGVKPPDIVTYDYQYNASFGRVGLRQRSWMNLGMDLWMRLSPQARIALIAHELAHDANKDVGRIMWVSYATRTVVNWYCLVVPYLNLKKTHAILNFILAFWTMLGVVVLYLLSFPIYGLAWVMILLTMNDSRRAEYLADEFAARSVGSLAVIELHRHMRPRYDLKDVTPLLFSHPSSEYRMRFLKERPSQFGSIHATEAEMRQIDEELAKVYQKTVRELNKPLLVESSYWELSNR